MKKLTITVLCIVLILSLCGCGGYASSYKAVGFAHSNVSDYAFMSFHSFDGKMVFKLKSVSGDVLNYSAKLEEGSAVVYYDCNGTKTELFSLHGGDDFSASYENIQSGRFYVIVETDGKCQGGDISFTIE